LLFVSVGCGLLLLLLKVLVVVVVVFWETQIKTKKYMYIVGFHLLCLTDNLVLFTFIIIFFFLNNINFVVVDVVDVFHASLHCIIIIVLNGTPTLLLIDPHCRILHKDVTYAYLKEKIMTQSISEARRSKATHQLKYRNVSGH